MRLRWTTLAANDLYYIVQHIRKDNLLDAVKRASTLYAGCDGLPDFPCRGRQGRIDGAREVGCPGLPSIIVYKIKKSKRRTAVLLSRWALEYGRGDL